MSGTAKHTKTEDDHIDAQDDRAPGCGEEVADTSQHHEHTHGDIDKTTAAGQHYTFRRTRTRKATTYKMFVKSILMTLWYVIQMKGIFGVW
jgi:hypothetical protein